MTATRGVELRLSQDPAADGLLSRSPFALLVGMLLDQQIPMEKAFLGPYVIASRLRGDEAPDPTGPTLEPGDVAHLEPEEFAAMCARPPAVHRFPGSMAARVQALATYVADNYGGDTASVWLTAPDGVELRGRLQALPGFGAEKARIFLAMLGKQLGVTPPGWREAAEPYGAEGLQRSVADVTGPESLAAVRADKRKRKAAGKTATAGATGGGKAATADASGGGKGATAGAARRSRTTKQPVGGGPVTTGDS